MSKREPHPVNPKGDQTWSNNDKLTPFTRNVIQVWSDGDGTNKDKTENGYAYVKNNVCIALTLTALPFALFKHSPKIQNRYRKI